ncbi:hypothetical protein NSMM_480078 [Nitrosomonas mobilis]|uniref:Uncharacterized protein n=1 Tax=Nitrosomonas mobilis TaxID=51642 RepID=A0A1G5SFU9_9PROT|nr:hypothetical protein NSMM_480078 [Nitrosomonas mobilis]
MANPLKATNKLPLEIKETNILL